MVVGNAVFVVGQTFGCIIRVMRNVTFFGVLTPNASANAITKINLLYACFANTRGLVIGVVGNGALTVTVHITVVVVLQGEIVRTVGDFSYRMNARIARSTRVSLDGFIESVGNRLPNMVGARLRRC